jgi:hypothetical protein
MMRYAGAIPWSVAAHLCLVAEMVAARVESESEKTIRWILGFTHDAAECCTGEILFGMKNDKSKETEARIHARILSTLNVPADWCWNDERDISVKSADRLAFIPEALGLGLPGALDEYRAAHMREPDTMPGDYALFDAIARSPFGSPDISLFDAVSPNGEREYILSVEPVRSMRGALLAIKDGAYEDAVQVIRSTIGL